MTSPDRLQQMYDAQRELQTNTMGIELEALSQEERIQYIKDMVLAISNELQAEVLGEVGWKPWARSRHINEIAYRSEMVDVWHFFMNLMLAVGMTPDELCEGYFTKRGVNVQRQEDGYDGVKCAGCGRAVDDPGWSHISLASVVARPDDRCYPVTT